MTISPIRWGRLPGMTISPEMGSVKRARLPVVGITENLASTRTGLA